MGGDYKSPEQARRIVARTSDGGRTWTVPKGPGPGGYRSAVAYCAGHKSNTTLVAAGPTGSDLSTDGGETWTPLGTMGFHAVGFAGPIDGGWGVGDDGVIARLQGMLRRHARANRQSTDRGDVSMATKPTRLQQQACDHLAEALFLITEAFRLDGKGKLSPAEFDELAAKVTEVSSQFSLDEIVVKALQRRAKNLSLTSSAADLITLMEGALKPLHTLLLPDPEFVELVKRLEEELGEV